MSIVWTLLFLCAAIIGFVFSSWRASRPTVLGKVRMMPWLEISIVLALIAILMLVHFVNLYGITTGRN